MKKIIKLGAIGIGNRTRKYIQYITAHPEEAHLSAIVENDPERLRKAQEEYGLRDEECFLDADDFFSEKRDLDGIIIGTPDNLHYVQCMKAISLGYDVLLEKPIAQSLGECEAIERAAAESGVKVSVCYVLRYHPYFLKIKEILRRGDLGSVISVLHTMNVGIDRMTHSYVRGPWGRQEDTTPSFISKCCHDVDLLMWLLEGSRVKSVSSFGSLKWFRKENAPDGSSDRCVTCSVEKRCPFSAVDLYKRRNAWTDNFNVPEGRSKSDAIDDQLLNGPFGRCVYRCDNDVDDNQIVNLLTEDNVTVEIAMVGLTRRDGRTLRIVCSFGEIIADNDRIDVYHFDGREKESYDFSSINCQPLHAWSDLAIVEDFIESIREADRQPRSSIHDALASHAVCFKAEESRASGQTVKL